MAAFLVAAVIVMMFRSKIKHKLIAYSYVMLTLVANFVYYVFRLLQ